MNTATLLAFASALFGGALTFAVIWNERRSMITLAFGAGVAVLAVESILTGVALMDGRTVEEMIYWQRWRLLATSFLPGTWLFFSLSYGRGNYREFLDRWRFTLLFFLIIPPLLGLFGDLFAGTTMEPSPGHYRLGLGMGGYVLNLMMLIAMVLVLMNLERTFRAS